MWYLCLSNDNCYFLETKSNGIWTINNNRKEHDFMSLSRHFSLHLLAWRSFLPPLMSKKRPSEFRAIIGPPFCLISVFQQQHGAALLLGGPADYTLLTIFGSPKTAKIPVLFLPWEGVVFCSMFSPISCQFNQFWKRLVSF